MASLFDSLVGHFRRVFGDSFRSEPDSDVVYSAGIEWVGLDVFVKFYDHRSNRSRDIRAVHFVMDDAGQDIRQNVVRRLALILL